MKNSEILFIYDAKLTNPNGDADDENRPRMDYERSINLVSDVRLKRYIRDYLQDKGYEIFVGKVDDKTVNATDRLKNLFGKYDGKINLNKIGIEEQTWMLDQLIDVRMFGATMPIKSEESKGSSMIFTGPIQFNWGYSLNKVSLVESSTITSHFSSESSNERGSMGKDYRLYYSLIAFHGVVSAHRAEHTRLKIEDVHELDMAMIKAIPLQATRSKVGQYPRLYMRVQYTNKNFISGDFRDLLELQQNEGLRSISEVELDVSKLIEKLNSINEKIDAIYFWQDQNLLLKYNDQMGLFYDLVPDSVRNKIILLNEVEEASL
ncbi:type I-B CRISPR-associated protein Cas7/Csh2 [Calidifontibacillus erzurumensis]|uniref:Type I-B CRISPR-associated protein Cas7/Csh2 n=1 Tax=Calidifontibacillus erzurumensis TaxID=2741433 RepID=A0A8J8KCW8_9BACI|nr:type I-B CRISPR-associated protein Cas7/Csh2 [Calidifontibacillus erzurumensis]NSL53032.1 type I-B CRISPR-associated protein Cas7/Csh2 [Calidifontibacillus erzurumensis]